ncbi:MAG: serine/threonine-protein kinase [Eubacteriales bacterium]|nr:serine/threonine-protein kinase [Eubacteriales bacterium]
MLSQLSTPIIPTLPEQWSDWELTELIGAGTYGTVYKAQKKNDPNCVSAIKIINFPANENEANILLREHRGDILSASNYCSQLAEEFQREAEILHTLADCENVVAYQDFLMMPQEQQIGQTVYIQMEYLNSFSQYCVDNELQESDVIRLGVDICTALSACHKKGIIHRDIKPDNIMVSKDGKFKLGDFGVAKTVSKTLSSLSIKGTFSYMAPEVYFGQRTNKQADIYSVGMMLYRLMNNNHDPFIDTDKKIVYHKDKEYAMQQRMSGEPLPFPVTASPEFGDIILKACAFDRKKRYKTADEFLSDLKKLQQNKYCIKKKRRQLTKFQKRLVYCIMSVAVILGAALGVNQAVEFYNTIDKGKLRRIRGLDALQGWQACNRRNRRNRSNRTAERIHFFH